MIHKIFGSPSNSKNSVRINPAGVEIILTGVEGGEGGELGLRGVRLPGNDIGILAELCPERNVRLRSESFRKVSDFGILETSFQLVFLLEQVQPFCKVLSIALLISAVKPCKFDG